MMEELQHLSLKTVPLCLCVVKIGSQRHKGTVSFLRLKFTSYAVILMLNALQIVLYLTPQKSPYETKATCVVFLLMHDRVF